MFIVLSIGSDLLSLGSADKYDIEVGAKARLKGMIAWGLGDVNRNPMKCGDYRRVAARSGANRADGNLWTESKWGCVRLKR